jgi:subfamily B ATP-binding cassette protein HlyB/CyaB
MEKIDSGLVCSFLALQFYNISFNPISITHNFKKNEDLSESDIVSIFNSNGLKSKLKSFKKKEAILNIHFPLIYKDKQNNFILALQNQERNNQILIKNPNKKEPELISTEDFLNSLNEKNEIILIQKKSSFLNEDFKFGINWFIEAFIKYKKILIEVIVVSFFIQVLSLLSPIFFQVTVDKVLVHNSMTTLDVLMIGLVLVSIFEVVLSFIRTFLLNHTTNKIDVTLGAHLFSHLMNLPLSFFNSRKVGQIATRVRELDTIRAFITSSALTICIDLVFTIVFFIVMWNYSKLLTIIVFCSIPFYVAIAIIITPILQKKLDEKFLKAAENQAFLVESISGIETIKSIALEPKMRDHWNNQISDYVLSSFKVNNLGNFYTQFSNLINKLTMIFILYYGSQLVISQEITIGMLIAFNMLASRISGPILNMAQLWNDFQQANISIKRLSDILNTKQEKGYSGNSLIKGINGNVVFDNVSFRYKINSKNVIENFSLKVNQGDIIGIVGRSGSGKSTITKLIQKLHTPNDGRILIDGIDISTLDPSWIRKQIGVVLQDNFLFNRTIKENISISNPSLPLDYVINAAKMAGAHEFIAELPEGYETIIEEGGTNLSGGQKQRIAIARALVNNPKILIFDEATSALDYESEKIIQNNMKNICKNRTVFIIAHRLTAIKDASKIVVMEKGQIIEYGTIKELINKNGFFKYLNDLQLKGQ